MAARIVLRHRLVVPKPTNNQKRITTRVSVSCFARILAWAEQYIDQPKTKFYSN